MNTPTQLEPLLLQLLQDVHRNLLALPETAQDEQLADRVFDAIPDVTKLLDSTNRQDTTRELVEALDWALLRIRTSLDRGERYEWAQSILDRATRGAS